MILGIDWGQKKIGLALAHHDMHIASAWGVIVNDDHVFTHILQLTAEHDIDLIIVGKSAHSTQNDNVDMIEQFGKQCQKICNVPVKYATEMFSTREAHHNLKQAGKKNIGQHDDAEAARIILQNYVDAQNDTM